VAAAKVLRHLRPLGPACSPESEGQQHKKERKESDQEQVVGLDHVPAQAKQKTEEMVSASRGLW